MSYALEWAPAGVGLAVVIVLAVPPLAMIALAGLLLAALAAVVATGAAIVAAPYLLFGYIRQRRRSSR